MLKASQIRGVCAFVPTPSRPGVSAGDSVSSVELDETVRMVDRLIDDGVSMLALCGTTGESAALLFDEKTEYVATVIERVAGRVPVFAGAIALGTREVIRQMRVFLDRGASGAIVAPPFWQAPTLENAVGFMEDLSEAVPNLPTMVYSNKFFFKFEFPTEFWERIAANSTVVATKVSYDFRKQDYEVAGQRIKFLGGEGNYRAVHEVLGKQANAVWATSAAMGPAPWLALVAAAERGDADATERVLRDIESVPPPLPMEEFHLFNSYNIQLEKARIAAAGYVRCGEPRPPYTDLPSTWRAAAERNAKAWLELCERYRAGA